MSRSALPSEDILHFLAEAGVSKSEIARRLNIAASAVTNLYNGSRHLKHDEAIALMALIPHMDDVAELPVVAMSEAGAWRDAIKGTVPIMAVPVHLKGEFAIGVDKGTSNPFLTENSILVVNPSDRDLYSEKLYLLRGEDGSGVVMRYLVNPSRFEPISQTGGGGAVSVGSSSFSVIGRVTGAVVVL